MTLFRAKSHPEQCHPEQRGRRRIQDIGQASVAKPDKCEQRASASDKKSANADFRMWAIDSKRWIAVVDLLLRNDSCGYILITLNV